jgi:hypothetical protein
LRIGEQPKLQPEQESEREQISSAAQRGLPAAQRTEALALAPIHQEGECYAG